MNLLSSNFHVYFLTSVKHKVGKSGRSHLSSGFSVRLGLSSLVLAPVLGHHTVLVLVMTPSLDPRPPPLAVTCRGRYPGATAPDNMCGENWEGVDS